jgi:hypothetical protein
MVNVSGKKTFFTAAITAWLVLAVVFAGVYAVAEYDHEHIDTEGRHVPAGEHCHICLEIQIALRIIEAFGRLGLCLLLAGFIKHTVFCVKPQPSYFVKKPIELLKVRFNC